MTRFYTAPNAFIYPPGPAYLSVKPFCLLLIARESVTDTVWYCDSGTFWVTIFLLMELRSWSVLAPTRLHLSRHPKVLSNLAKNCSCNTSIWIWLTPEAGNSLSLMTYLVVGDPLIIFSLFREWTVVLAVSPGHSVGEDYPVWRGSWWRVLYIKYMCSSYPDSINEAFW